MKSKRHRILTKGGKTRSRGADDEDGRRDREIVIQVLRDFSSE